MISTPPSGQPPRLVAGGGSARAAVQLEAVSQPAPRQAPPRQAAAAPSARLSRAPAPDMDIAPVREAVEEPVARRSAEPRAAAPTRTRRAVEQEEAVAPEAPAKEGSWVSELLRRASRDEAGGSRQATTRETASVRKDERRQSAQASDSLNSLSMDIARAIDHDASIELWERYQSGERNVFTRRLYTLQGQKIFDDIRSKYTRDPEFHAAVDRYIADFERLLDDVGQNDSDNTMTRTYLSSDTGKVYTMLAHAAGRFGSD